MKHIFLTIAMLLALVFTTQAQHKEGDLGILFGFKGFSNLGVSDVNGGAGARYYITPSTSLRGTMGFQTFGNSESANIVSVSGAMLFDLTHKAKTSAYLAPQFTYNHIDGSDALYSFGLLLGAEYEAWDGITLGAEYGVVISGSNNKTDFSFGHTNGQILATFWL
jgi:hypothetical protein